MMLLGPSYKVLKPKPKTLRKGGGIALGTHTVGAGVEEVLNTGDPILVGTACGPAILRAHPSES